MSENKYKEDLKDIRDIMNRSSRFISLSGYSGVVAGILALIGVYLGYRFFYMDYPSLGLDSIEFKAGELRNLLLVAGGVLLISAVVGIFFTRREVSRRNEKMWDLHTKRLLINLAIPLLTGGVLALMLLLKGFVGLMVPITLIFYGLALVNASKYTLNEVRILGLVEILIGLLSVPFIAFGLFFWAAGFGVVHIVYGVFMQRKYGS